MRRLFFAIFIILLRVENLSCFYDPHCDGKQVIVHLFEWKWTDIALECERFLAPAGYCGVQTSPPNEHITLPGDDFPWWQRYQPVSYLLNSRSGNREQFIDMVERCNAVGVRIFVDTVINHMAGADRQGTGTAGSSFNTMGTTRDFPAVPFTEEDFTPRDMCPSGDGGVNDYSDPDNIRNCYLVGLCDLYGATDYVRDKVAEYLNDLINIGVAGFRVDAAKHMWPEDIAGIQDRLNFLPTEHGFKAGSKPFFCHEVIDRDDGAVIVDEYFDLGWVTEFRYTQKIAWATYGDWGQMNDLYVPGWGMGPPDRAFIFVDNHDNQRGHGGGGDVVTHKYPADYTFATAFTLAWDYGFTRVMSSYYFEDNETSEGPPHYDDGYYTTADVIINDDNSCGGGWVCEHRWNAIYKMAAFRTACAGAPAAEFWSTGDAVGISRTGKGYFAMSKSVGFSKTVATGMPSGEYCNIIDSCASKVTVGSDGSATIVIDTPEKILAICVGCTGDEPPPVTATAGTPPAPTDPNYTTSTKVTTPTAKPTESTTKTTVPDGPTTTSSSTTSAVPSGKCCRTVQFSSDGEIIDRNPEALGSYTKISTDATGKTVYKKKDNEIFLHYVEDVPHRFEAWVFSDSVEDKMGNITNEEKNDCVDDLINTWDVMFDNAWHEDTTAKVTCDESDCCPMFSISSSGPIGDKYPEAMTTFSQIESIINEKPVYSSENYFIFYHVDVPHHFQGWTISTALNDLGEITKEGDVACAESTDGVWEYLDESLQWSTDDTFAFDCIETCCSEITISSSGEASQNFPELLGTYKMNGEENGRPTYQGPSDHAQLRYVEDIPHRWSGWAVGEGAGKLTTEEDSDCPSDAGETWEVFVGNSWVKDDTLSINCNF